MKNIPEFWEFMEGQFVNSLHWEYWYEEEDRRYIKAELYYVVERGGGEEYEYSQRIKRNL